MKRSRVLEERIKRIKILFRELGCELAEEQRTVDVYTSEIESEKEFQGTVLIDRNNKFMEMAYSFSFSSPMMELIKQNMEEVIRICYEYGCYFNFFRIKGNLTFSLFSKIYFSGLNYYCLRDSLKDFRNCTKTLGKIIDFDLFNKN